MRHIVFSDTTGTMQNLVHNITETQNVRSFFCSSVSNSKIHGDMVEFVLDGPTESEDEKKLRAELGSMFPVLTSGRLAMD